MQGHRRHHVALVCFALLVLAACTSTEPTTTSSVPTTGPGDQTTSSSQPTTTTTIPEVAAEPFAGLGLPTDQGTHFAGSGACSSCHTGMTDATGDDISIDTNWRSTVMANAARDPFWRATVRSEVVKTPQLWAVIEDKCATCHMPMARTTDSFTGQPGMIFANGYTTPTHPLHSLAADGVSCTTCHQIQPDNLTTAESFSGGFLIDPLTEPGQRVTYGPSEATDDASVVMGNVSGYVPVQSAHIQESAMCATCHTLYTPYVDASGTVAGLFPEQMPFLELQAGTVEQSCQDCHMPVAAGEVSVSNVAGVPRTDVNRHYFVGGNDYLMAVMSVYGPEMGLTASSDQIAATRALTQAQLTARTAELAIGAPSWEGALLIVPIEVRNTAGHKFPTGFPSRRAWLHVTLTDPAGEVVFESGAWTLDGLIVGNDNDENPTGYEPHRDTVTHPRQVQIYETILMDTDGELTTTLLRGAGYAKDNRLPPEGFDKTAVPADIAVHGAAFDDANFAGGTDVVEYQIDTAPFGGPFRLEAELLYQPIGFRWGNNLSAEDGPEVATFVDYYQAVPDLPVVIAVQTLDVVR